MSYDILVDFFCICEHRMEKRINLVFEKNLGWVSQRLMVSWWRFFSWNRLFFILMLYHMKLFDSLWRVVFAISLLLRRVFFIAYIYHWWPYWTVVLTIFHVLDRTFINFVNFDLVSLFFVGVVIKFINICFDIKWVIFIVNYDH